MEGRKEAFRMYLEQTGTTDALTKVLIKLYDLKDKRPDNEDAALQFMKDNLSNNFPSQNDYDKLLAEVEISRKKVEAIQKAAEEARERADVERELRKMKKTGETSAKAADAVVKADANATADGKVDNVATVVIKTIDEAKKRLEELKKHQNCKSLLVECLSLEMFEKLKADQLAQLLLCIRRGLEDPNVLVGINAVAEDDYVTFKEIFDPIIKKYFGSDLSTALQSSWKNATGNKDDSPLNCRSHLVLRTRITCARSMAKFPFIPGMNEDQKNKLKADVEAELKLLVEDNVKGRYHDLTNMNAEVKTKLQERHLLFQSVNEQLKAAGVLDCSIGRAIFCNDNQNLVVWVNEEEHLKFIATGMNSIKEAFIRLRTVVENCEFLTFKTTATNQNPPTITFCPTFVGAALHVSVVVKCLNVATRGKMEDIAKTLKIGVKPTTVADEFELTNKPKLDMTEFDAMKEFIVEVGKFLKAAHIETAADAVARLEELKKCTPPPESLLVKHLTTDICDELKGKDDPTEKTFLNCIRLGLEEGTLPIGIYAADHDAYKKFAKIFEPILTEYYGLNDYTSLVESKWTDDDKKLNFNSHLILRTRIACAKSVEKYSFVPVMDNVKLNELKEEVKKKLAEHTFADLCAGKFEALDKLTNDERDELKQNQLLFEPENLRLQTAGATDLSAGRAIFFNTAKNLVVWINEEEHLKFIATGTNKTGNSTHVIKDAFTNLRNVVDHCGSLTFKKSKKADATNMDALGHLTFCPTNLGATINVSAVVKFPNVAEREKMKQKMTKEDEKKKLPFYVEPTTVADEFELTKKPKLDKTEFDAMEEFIVEVGKFLKEAGIKTTDDAVARLEELQKFTPPPESLLVKNLTKKIITGSTSKATAKTKTLLDCIKIGLEDEKLPVGIFAADESCYETFEQIFKPILIAYYGGVDPIQIEASKWDDNNSQIAGLDFDSGLIIRVRITCARSLKDYPFVPAMEEKDLNALKDEVQQALETTFCASGGTFVDWDKLVEVDRKELQKNQLLFEPENSLLLAAGATNLSEGRAICYNTDKNLVIWINEEEHLKFIATGTNKTGNSTPVIKDAFTNLKDVFDQCGSLTFKQSESSSFLTDCNLAFCPTFLGPAIHVSAIVKLAKAAARGKVEYIAKALPICVKPTTVADEFEVTNIPRLDKTEFDAIKEFVEQLQILVGQEEQLVTTIEEAWASWELLEKGTVDSIMKKSKLDQLEFDAEKSKGQTANDKTLLDCIRPGLEDPISSGIYAVDADAYETFPVLFKKYVEIIHPLSPLPKLSDDGWDGANDTWLFSDYSSVTISSRITCRRSFKDFPFIPAMTTTQLRKLRATVKAILEEYDVNGKFYDLTGIDGTTKGELIKDGHWFEPVNERLRSVGVKDFTTGRAVFVSKQNNLTVWLCEEDHLKFISTAADGDIAKTFIQLKEAVDKFKNVEFHKHNDWGWKTFCPTNLGSTIEATIVLKIPKITHAMSTSPKTFEEYCTDENIPETSDICEKTLSDKNEHEISNKIKFGKEFELVQQVFNAAKELAAKENSL
ncbi:creatine kinase, flagellar-like [Bradysia coprophila]|uniref:creatine kinase, flagellar-like n=1 Tax=Bradysia coprophila TaxID=38358 RepID=UPI00187D9172|nr:creatine kinase, flagellar-like [Bradysia coprophila]